jgi:hypothetical protein
LDEIHPSEYSYADETGIEISNGIKSGDSWRQLYRTQFLVQRYLLDKVKT